MHHVLPTYVCSNFSVKLLSVLFKSVKYVLNKLLLTFIDKLLL